MTNSYIRTTLWAIGAVSMLAVMGTADVAVAGDRFKGQTLKVGTWGGKWGGFQKDIIVPKIEAEGGTVQFVHASTQDNIAKLAAARGRDVPIDVMEILDAIMPTFTKENLLQKIDLSQVPNTKYLKDGFYDEWKVATWIVQEGICFNRDKFKEMGLPAPKTYKDLGHSKLEGLVVIPDITSGGGIANFAGIVYAAGGDVKNIQPGLNLLREINALKYWKRAGEAINMLQTGDVAAALIYSGHCARTRKSGAPVDAVMPMMANGKKGVMKNGWIGIVKGTKVPELATFYVNQFINYDFQSTWAPAMGVIPSNQEALKAFLADEVSQEMFVPLEENQQIDYNKADIPDWTDRWTRTAGKSN
tara:strand:+ start:1565 stop:2641 length:1077 start_codon:yes stop_codon:yes gene_type:complete